MTRPIRLNPLPALILSMPFILTTPLLVKAHPCQDDPDAKQGIAQWKAGDFDAAIASFTNVIKKFPGVVIPLVRRGMIYHDNNDLDNAIDDFTEVVEHHKNNNRALYLRARCYYEKGDLDKALDDANRALNQGTKVGRFKDERAEAFVIGGMIYYERDQFDKALPLMAAYASQYFGRASDGLLRTRVPAGRVDIGEVKSLGEVPETNNPVTVQPAAKPQ